MEFAVGSSISAVCKYCNTTVRRSDRGVENLGKMADIADTPTMVAVGDSGSLAGQSFVVLGRVQLKHDLGGVWDEYYLGFGAQKWGWLAYAQGNYYATSKLEPAPQVPTMRQLHLEAPVVLGQAQFRVVEIKAAEVASAEGELPFTPRPGQMRYYADLVGPRNGFATIDWGEGDAAPEVFIGQQLPESQLTITQRSERPRKDIPLDGLKCPGCGAPLKIATGNRVERIACQYCGTISESASQQIIARQQAARAKPLIPLGSTGALQGVQYTVVGFVLRSGVLEDEMFTWSEYLLFSPGVGFRWLVDDEGTWRFVAPLNVAELDISRYPSSVTYNGRAFRQRNSNMARVEFVIGEFYWKVAVGESVQATDLESGSELISREAMEKEVAWSYSTAVPWNVIAQAFRVQGMPPAPANSGGGGGASGGGGGAAVTTVVVLIVLLVFVIIFCGMCVGMCGGGSGSSGVRGGGTTGGGWSGGK
jgi:hypothetical protein